jgi:hypothetical protein
VMLVIDYLALDQAVLRKKDNRHLSKIKGIHSDAFS